METKHLILLYLSGKASQDERKVLEAWIAESNDNKSLFEDMKLVDEASNNLHNTILIDTNLEWTKFMDKVNENSPAKVIELPKREEAQDLSRSVFTRRFALAAAASLILILGAIFLFPDKYIEVNSGSAPVAISLNDGSEVKLSENSYLKYPKEFESNSREIFLRGDAQIDIAKDPSKPFTVNSPLTGIEVLGTIIDLIASSESSKLGVVEGKVNMYSNTDKSVSVIANTGDVILFTPDGFEDLTPPPPAPSKPETKEKVIVKEEPKQEIKVEVKDSVVAEPVKESEPELPRSKFLMKSLMNHLKKMHPEKDKFKLKAKYNDDDTAAVTIAAPLETILKQLEEQYNIEYKDDCDGCYEIISISKKE